MFLKLFYFFILDKSHKCRTFGVTCFSKQIQIQNKSTSPNKPHADDVSSSQYLLFGNHRTLKQELYYIMLLNKIKRRAFESSIYPKISFNNVHSVCIQNLFGKTPSTKYISIMVQILCTTWWWLVWNNLGWANNFLFSISFSFLNGSFK